jgi:hypothetical protein
MISIFFPRKNSIPEFDQAKNSAHSFLMLQLIIGIEVWR